MVRQDLEFVMSRYVPGGGAVAAASLADGRPVYYVSENMQHFVFRALPAEVPQQYLLRMTSGRVTHGVTICNANANFGE